MNKISALVVFVFTFLIATAQTESKTVNFAGNKFSIQMPPGVDTMTTDNIWTKYHKTPDGKTKYYSNADLSLSAIFTEVMNSVTEADMVKHKDEFLEQIQTKYELTENEVIAVNGHKIVVVSFLSDYPGGKIFNRRFFAVAGTKLIMVAFNATDEELEIRKAQIESSIRSVVIK